MGDYNLNLLNGSLHEPTDNFPNQMCSFSLIPVITNPTRITETSATLIDNIFTNDLKSELNSGILYSDISDHFPVFTITNHSTVTQTSTFLEITDMKEANLKRFDTLLDDCNFSSMLACDNAQEAFTSFHTTINAYYNTAFTRKKIQIGHRNRLPWLTPAMKISIRKKTICHI